LQHCHSLFLCLSLTRFETALHYAAENGHREVVRALLKAGAVPDSSDRVLAAQIEKLCL
jgi:hypothetical protein